MKQLLFTLLACLLLMIAWAAVAQDSTVAVAEGPLTTGKVVAGLAGLFGSLVAGKIKKNYIPMNNNLIPATNPALTAITAYTTTGDLHTTAAATAGSLAAWGIHQLGKRLMKKLGF